MANKSYYVNDNNQLKNYKLEKYKIDNDLKILYKVTTTYNDTEPKILKALPIEELDNNIIDSFFMLIKQNQCDNFAIYYENNYDIKKINDLITNQELNFTFEQLDFLKQFFISIKNVAITIFDMRIKPIINNTVDSNSSNNNGISNTFQSKPRILN
ncbi:MAG: hypothetical protein H9Q65_05670 [Spiroplasma ixodetis]|nr:hypothetical protein [Spiroplasma ixodetis]MBP1528711.1 hypothetical protein [Spiroplasma ixodetis]